MYVVLSSAGLALIAQTPSGDISQFLESGSQNLASQVQIVTQPT